MNDVFEVNPSPPEVANKLLAIVFDEKYQNCILALMHMTEAEIMRYMFSVFLFTAELPRVLGVFLDRKELWPLVSMVHPLMLTVWKQTDRLVRVGDFILTDDEYARLPDPLGFGTQRVTLDTFYTKRIQEYDSSQTALKPDSQVRMGTLLEATGYIRGQQQLNDMLESRHTLAENPDSLIVYFGSMFLRYIFAADSPSLSPDPMPKAVCEMVANHIYERTLVVFSQMSCQPG